MNGTEQTCKSCSERFPIEGEDVAFYEKINVPAPTWCPQCRMRRRMSFMNERSLYKRACDMCRKEIISIFPAGSPRAVYCQSCWWSDKWDAASYGREVDFSRPFFKQLEELLARVPEAGLQTMYTTMVNSEYCNIASYLKNCYLLFNSDYSEDCAYSTCLERSRNCLDMYMSDICELCYMSTNLYQCSRTFFSSNCTECSDVWFSRNLKGCSDCFGCVNLRGKRYHIFNQPHTKEEYQAKLAQFLTGSYAGLQDILKKTEQFQKQYPRKYMEGLQNTNVSGDYIFNSKNVVSGYEVTGTEDSKYCHFLFITGTKDSYDFTMWGGNAQRMYECMGSGNNQKNAMFCYNTWSDSFNLQYCCHILARNSNLFGCVALRNKQYCILNRQYTKEEYERLIPKVIDHMNAMPYTDALGRTYRYGEFFPPELSAFAHNESLAQKYLPITPKQAQQFGYSWIHPEKTSHPATISTTQLPDAITAVADAILQETISCEHEGRCNEQCTGAFKLIPEELAFYRRFSLSLPRLCHNCRHYALLAQRPPMVFVERSCQCAGEQAANGAYQNTTNHFHGMQACPNIFKTYHFAERKEIIYCEQCYNTEVA